MLFFRKSLQFGVRSTMGRNMSMTLVRQITAAATQLLVVVLIARQLGPEGNGFYSMAVLLPTMMANFLNLGVSPATVYYVSRSEYAINLVLKENSRLALWLSLLGLVVMVPMVLFWGGSLFPGIPKDLLYISLALFPVSLFLAFTSAVLQGLEEFKAFNFSILLPPVVTLLGAIFSFYVIDGGIRGVLIAFIAGQLAALLTVFFFVRKYISGSLLDVEGKKHESCRYRSRIFGYGWKAHLSNIITFVNYRADIFLVNFYISPVATGLYIVAVQIAEKIWIPSQAASTVLLPRLSAMADTPEERLALTKKGFWVVAVITALASLVALVTLYYLIDIIFGYQYREALPALIFLMPGIVFWAGSRVQANCIAAAGKPEWNMYTSVAVLLINLLANVVLIPVMGISGAAVATTVAYTFDALIKSALVKKTIYLTG
jgi:O-antigen/teichoic acid export membrane protein